MRDWRLASRIQNREKKALKNLQRCLYALQIELREIEINEINPIDTKKPLSV
jgi:hypothetical protein